MKKEWQEIINKCNNWDHISSSQKLTESFIREFSDKVNWGYMSRYQKLSEQFIKEFSDKVNWSNISRYQKLSEQFIREFGDKVNWEYISYNQKLSEQFIREFSDKVYWNNISCYQKLSEQFIREFSDKVNWNYISRYQKLSESFIREFNDKVNWDCISDYQKLSEIFIREFQDKIDWIYISRNQKLTESFIREFSDKVNWGFISKYQKLSEQFIREFKLNKPKSSWLYETTENKLKYIKENTDYEVIDNEYIIAYKSIRSDNYSVFSFQYKYEIGETYTSHCDCNLDNENSFGLSAWTKEKALEYYSKGKLLKVKIPISQIGAIVHDNNKIRCFELTVLREMKWKIIITLEKWLENWKWVTNIYNKLRG